jgi:DNA-binding PadR family transcriptional regulator
MIQDFAASASVIWPAPRGEIYRELARLRAQGFAVPDEAAGVRNRRKWRITAAGRAELKRWLRAEQNYQLRYEPILRAAFLGALGPKEMAARLAADRKFFEGELGKLKEAGKLPPSRPKTAGRRRYALPMAIRFYEAMLAWCDEAERLNRG